MYIEKKRVRNTSTMGPDFNVWEVSAHHPLFSEVNPDRGDELGVEVPVRVLVQEAGLPNS